jgi:hypothetical protein
MDYSKKYLKYKNKYLILKKLIGGNCDKKGASETNETYIKRGCKVDLLPIIEGKLKSDEDKNKENKIRNYEKLNKLKLEDLLKVFDIKDLLQKVFTVDQIMKKIEEELKNIKFSKIKNNGNKIYIKDIKKSENFWAQLDYTDIIEDYKNFSLNPTKFFEHFKNFDVVQLASDNLKVNILINKLNEAKVNNDKDLIALAFLYGNDIHLNLNNDKNKSILSLIYNPNSLDILNENFEKKFIEYAPNDMKKIFYFSNYEQKQFIDKVKQNKLVTTQGYDIPESLRSKIQLLK